MNFSDFQNRFHITLNTQQLEAVRQTEGPVLLLAVPGSGKTTVLVTRLGYMIFCKGIDPASILTLTYTVAAAKDMSQRFEKIFGREYADRLRFGTINSLCYSIIRHYSRQIGRAPFEVESNEKVLSSLIAQLYRKNEPDALYPNEGEIKNVRSLITYIKNMQLSEEEIERLGIENRLHLAGIYRDYQAALRERGKMDFDDQMIYALNILKKSPETLHAYQRRFRYICVDEAQDTSKIQHEIIRLLASSGSNVFMVGDEDQSIYGFRAAYPQALLDFKINYPGARVLLLEENFRSSQRIVSAADRLIRHNKQRYKKKLFTERPAGAEIRNIELKSRRAQFTYLLKAAKGHADHPSGIVAVLYRNNESALPLIDLLERAGVSYGLPNRDLLFFTNRTVTDIRSFMLFAKDPKNTEAFLQIYYKMNLFLSRKEAESACRICRSRKITVFEALETHCGLSRDKISRLRTARMTLQAITAEQPASAIRRILSDLGYRDHLNAGGIGEGKVQILRYIAYEEETCESFLARLDWLKERIASRPEPENCGFILSTIHSAKGLEYDEVYLLDCFDGVFPLEESPGAKTAGNNEAAFEEERRIYYVAVTRARNRLTVFTLPQTCAFTEELLGRAGKRKAGTDFLPFPKKPAFGFSSSKAASVKSRKKRSNKERLPFSVPVSRAGDQDPGSFYEFKDRLGAGVCVVHASFGEGVITDAGKDIVRIYFENTGEKKFLIQTLFDRKILKIKE